MADLKGTTPVSAPLSPGHDDRNTWPTHKAKWGQGGLKLCRTIAERDAIPNERKYQTIAFVETGATKQAEWYYWSGVYEDGSDGDWIQWHPPVNGDTGSIDVTGINRKIQSLQDGQRILQNNIDQKPDGFAVSDQLANVFNDISKLEFGKGFLVEHDPSMGEKVSIKYTPEILVTNGQEDTSVTKVIKAFEFPDATITVRDPDGANVGVISLPHSAGSSSSLTVDDGTTNVGGVSTINLENMSLVEEGSGVVRMSPFMEVSNVGGDYYLQNTKAIDVYWPLKFEASRKDAQTNDPDRVSLSMDHASFEPIHAPSFLAYLKEEIEVTGRPTDRGHHDGAIWLDDLIVSKSPYIGSKMITKSYTIEEADNKDPNITGGTTYVIAFKAGFKGTAPDDGYVRIYLYNTSPNPYEPKGYLMDDNGQPMVVERHYKAGDNLDSLEIVGAVTAKGQQEFSCHIVHNFTSEHLVLADPVENITGLLIQAITPTAGTGDALQQYELDTQDDIVFVKHYLGEDRATLKYNLLRDEPLASITKGAYEKAADGWTSYAVENIKAGVVNNHYVVSDNGTDICDFTLGKVFSAEETKLLRGKDIEVTVTLTDKSNAYKVVIMKWAGEPNKYTPDIFTSRKDGGPVWSTNWTKVGELFISEDAVVGDHTMTKAFVLPTDAVNYGIFIYPVEAQLPLVMNLKELKLDVKPSFIGIAFKEIRKYNEKHMYFSDEFKQFVQNTQGYASLRYTINANELPAPCGIPGRGLADIVIDTSVNQVFGSGARGGEGALLFNSEGEATISTDLRLWSEKAEGAKSLVKFWWAKVAGNSFEKIKESEGSFEISGGTKNVLFKLPEFTLEINSGDKLALRMQGDSADAAFLECVDNTKPLVQTNVKFKELTI